MRYLKPEEKNKENLTPEHTVYGLKYTEKGIDFFSYIGNRGELDANKSQQEQEIDSYHRGYFLRKGFSRAVSQYSDVITPIYEDNQGNEFFPESRRDAIGLIYQHELNISGFRFNETATEKQKEDAFGKLVNIFVSTSRNLDFESENNIFIIEAPHSDVWYNHGGSGHVQFDGVEVEERLGLNTERVQIHRQYLQNVKAGLRKGL